MPPPIIDSNFPARIKILFSPLFKRHKSLWYVPALYILGAVLLSRVVPLLPGGLLGRAPLFSHITSTTLLSAIATGMISFTGFIFSMIFVMIQFGSTTLSPRLATFFLHDRVTRHALGIFIATFVYALLTITSSDQLLGGGKMDYAIFLVLALLLGSMGMFLGLIQRLSLLQVTNILAEVGDQARQVIERVYPHTYEEKDEVAPHRDEDLREAKQVIHYHGGPAILQNIHLDRLLRLAGKLNAIIEVEYAVGDTVADNAQLLTVYGGSRSIKKNEVKKLVGFGGQRSIDTDPKYAIRLIVDVALRALSPALNDPATAVQALDQLDDLLRRLGRRWLGSDDIYDSRGSLRVVYPAPEWEDFLSLAIDEVRYYGANSLQVMRRLRALLEDLLTDLPEARRKAVQGHLQHVDQSIMQHFDAIDRRQAQLSDRQGIGVSRESESHKQEEAAQLDNDPPVEAYGE